MQLIIFEVQDKVIAVNTAVILSGQLLYLFLISFSFTLLPPKQYDQNSFFASFFKSTLNPERFLFSFSQMDTLTTGPDHHDKTYLKFVR